MDSFATSLRVAVTRLLLLAALLLPPYAFASYYTYASLCGHDGTCDTQEGETASAFASVTDGYVGVSLGSGTIKLVIS